MSDRRDHFDDDRLGLEAFDQVEPPRQWDEITRRAAAGPVADAPPATRGRWAPTAWIMAAAAVALVVVAAVAFSVRTGDDGAPAPATTPDETLPTPDTGAPQSTSPATSVPATAAPQSMAPPSASTTGAPVTAPTSVVPSAVVAAWEPDCVERFGGAGDLPDADPRLDEFTTLAAEPTLDIRLPTVDTANGVVPPFVSAGVVPGGVALALFENAVGGVEVSTLAMVEFDGSLRWRRCFEGEGRPSAVVADVDAQRLTLVSNVFAVEGGSAIFRDLDLATGLDNAAPVTESERSVGATDGEHVLLVRPWNAPLVEPGAELLLRGVGAATTDSIPYPDAAIGRAPDVVRYELVDDDGDLLVAATSIDSNAPDLVWIDGAWSTDPDELRRLPPTLWLPYGAAEELQLLDGAGEVVWAIPGFRGIGREGFNSGVADSVALVMECLDWSETTGCGWVGDTPPNEQLAAFDLATGERLWERPGWQAFALIDGDRGIVSADLDGDGTNDGWELIDLRTGARVDDVMVSTWSDIDIFRNACCGEGDYVFTELDGGVLLESLEDRLRVWLPPEESTPAVTVGAFG